MLHVVWIKRKAGRFYEKYKICDHNRGVRVCNIGSVITISPIGTMQKKKRILH